MSFPSETAFGARLPTEVEIRAFVGRNADYYLKKWQPHLTARGVGAGFNFAAFLFGALWAGYRRMWAVTWILYILYGLLLAEVIAELVRYSDGLYDRPPGLWEGLVAFCIGLVCGGYGNRWYLAQTSRAVARVREEGLPDEAAHQLLAQRGGATLVKSGGLFIFLVFAGVALLAALALAFPRA